jgi:hypothetical protein
MGVKRAVSPLFTAQGQQGMFMGPRGGGFQPPVCNVAPSSRFTWRHALLFTIACYCLPSLAQICIFFDQ